MNLPSVKRISACILIVSAMTTFGVAGEKVVPLDGRRPNAAARNDALTVKEYQVPKDYLKLAGMENAPDKFGMESGKLFTDGPTALFMPSRSVIVAKATKEGHRAIASHVCEVWKKYRDASGKKQR